jgi:hypothetical protein
MTRYEDNAIHASPGSRAEQAKKPTRQKQVLHRNQSSGQHTESRYSTSASFRAV